MFKKGNNFLFKNISAMAIINILYYVHKKGRTKKKKAKFTK